MYDQTRNPDGVGRTGPGIQSSASQLLGSNPGQFSISPTVPMHPAQQYAVSSSSSSVDGLTGPSLAADEPPVLRSTRFAPVRLSAQQLDGFHDAAHDALAQTVRDFVGVDGEPIDTARWRHVRSHIGASVYYERHRADKQQLALLVAGTLKARLTDVMEGLYMDTTETTRLVQHHINARFVDAEVLKVIEQRSPQSPYAYTGLKWAMLKASASGMVSSRDICYLEVCSLSRVITASLHLINDALCL
jgi:hypothetical protein